MPERILRRWEITFTDGTTEIVSGHDIARDPEVMTVQTLSDKNYRVIDHTNYVLINIRKWRPIE